MVIPGYVPSACSFLLLFPGDFVHFLLPFFSWLAATLAPLPGQEAPLNGQRWQSQIEENGTGKGKQPLHSTLVTAVEIYKRRPGKEEGNDAIEMKLMVKMKSLPQFLIPPRLLCFSLCSTLF